MLSHGRMKRSEALTRTPRPVPAEAPVIPRAFPLLCDGLDRDIFERLGRPGGDGVPRVEMSFLEIYIENVYDLLSSPAEVRRRTAS